MLSAELEEGLSSPTTDQIEYKTAQTRDERASAYRLVYESYLRAKLGGTNSHGMRVTPYHLLPTTETFIAVLRGETIFTMSLVLDGELGLPIECAYGREVEARRQRGTRLAEVSCLADRRSQFERFFPVFVRLGRLVGQHAWNRGVEELLAAVHPRHARFYRGFMNFEPMGEVREYPTARNHPAVGLALNFARLDRERPESFETFFGQWLPEEQLRPRPISPADIDYFRPMVDASFRAPPIGDLYDMLGEPADAPVLVRV